jgi:hypothetical protein
MKLIFRFSVFVLSVLFFSSCLRIVYIGKRIDPQIILSQEHHTIVFVNLFDYTSTDNVSRKEKIAYHNGVMGMLDGLASFSDDSAYTFLLGDTLKKGIPKGLLTTLLPADTIAAICRRNDANYLLALDSLSVHFDPEKSTDTNPGYNVNRSGNLYLNANFFLSLYSSAGDLTDRSQVDQSLLYRSGSAIAAFLSGQPSVGRVKDEVGYLAYQAGQDYVTKFYPSLLQETQKLYTGKVFSESNRYIFSKDWKKAIDLLEQLTKSNDRDIAEKARHNLDVAKEASEAKDR